MEYPIENHNKIIDDKTLRKNEVFWEAVIVAETPFGNRLVLLYSWVRENSKEKWKELQKKSITEVNHLKEALDIAERNLDG